VLLQVLNSPVPEAYLAERLFWWAKHVL
jgi:hypothetical protein